MSVEIINHYAKHAAEYLAERRVPAARTHRRHQAPARPSSAAPAGRPHHAVERSHRRSRCSTASLPSWLERPCSASRRRSPRWRGRRPCRASVTTSVVPHVLAARHRRRQSTGAAVVDEVDMVMFTGSTRTGRAIAVRCAERLIPCSLELGGKDPMVVLADADSAVPSKQRRGVGCSTAARPACRSSGCTSRPRSTTSSSPGSPTRCGLLRQGTDEPGAFSRRVGAMATASQLEIVERHVADAVAKGAASRPAAAGGPRASTSSPRCWPMSITRWTACARRRSVRRCPSCGWHDEAEAIRLANDSPYGLSASVWSGTRTGRPGGRQIEAGAVNINNVLVNLFQFAHPARRLEAVGPRHPVRWRRRHAQVLPPQAVVSDRLPMREPYWFPTVAPEGPDRGRGARLLGANDWRRKLGLRPRRIL